MPPGTRRRGVADRAGTTVAVAPPE